MVNGRNVLIFFRNIRPYLFITFLCIGGVFLFYRLVGYYWLGPLASSSETIRMQSDKVGSGQGEGPLTSRIILQRNLFGSGSLPSETEKDQSDLLAGLAKISPELLLMGTITGDGKEKEAVILDIHKAKQELYRIGDRINGAVVKDILREKVVLHFRERDETLDMADTRKYFSQIAASDPFRHQEKFPSFSKDTKGISTKHSSTQILSRVREVFNKTEKVRNH